MNIHNNVHEMRIKVTCARWLEARYNGLPKGTLINEFSANRSKARADLVYVSSAEVVAIEIKSRHDSISRLEVQVHHLKKLYNRVEVVVDRKHLDRARTVCSTMNIGLHLIEGDKIITVLKGRRRNIEASVLQKRVFPRRVRERKDFQPTEAFYRNFIIQKYGQADGLGNGLVTTTNFDADIIRRSNPNYTRRIKLKQRQNEYLESLKALSLALQSTHSSSSSSEETSNP